MNERDIGHREIAKQLREQITGGHLQAGDALPSEVKLADQYSVNRGTIRDAEQLLRNEGLIGRKPGKRGMYVRERQVVTSHGTFEPYADNPQDEGESAAWDTDVRAQGLTPSQRFECSHVVLSDYQAGLLGLDEATTASLRWGLRYVNDEPSSIVESLYPQWLVGEVTDLASPEEIQGGTLRMLAGLGYPQTGIVETLAARMPTPTETELLGLDRGTPLLIQVRVGYTNGRPFRLTTTIMPGDRCDIENTYGDVDNTLHHQ